MWLVFFFLFCLSEDVKLQSHSHSIKGNNSLPQAPASSKTQHAIYPHSGERIFSYLIKKTYHANCYVILCVFLSLLLAFLCGGQFVVLKRSRRHVYSQRFVASDNNKNKIIVFKLLLVKNQRYIFFFFDFKSFLLNNEAINSCSAIWKL